MFRINNDPRDQVDDSDQAVGWNDVRNWSRSPQ